MCKQQPRVPTAKRPYKPGTSASNEPTARRVSAIAIPNEPTGSSGLTRTTPSERAVVVGAIERTPIDSYWGRFDCPALLLYGADDQVGHPENAEHLHSALPNSKLVYIKDGGHFVIVEQAERFATEILDWINELAL